MPDREKVIRGLERFINNYERYITDWEPVTDALALLREQEPRVLTKEEAVHYMSDEEAYKFSEKVPLYVEHKTPDEWDFKWVRAETVYTWMLDLRMRQNYGITFRLWTSRPTEEQRKAVAWDE